MSDVTTPIEDARLRYRCPMLKAFYEAGRPLTMANAAAAAGLDWKADRQRIKIGTQTLADDGLLVQVKAGVRSNWATHPTAKVGKGKSKEQTLPTAKPATWASADSCVSLGEGYDERVAEARERVERELESGSGSEFHIALG
jgi:hypothetical protein